MAPTMCPPGWAAWAVTAQCTRNTPMSGTPVRTTKSSSSHPAHTCPFILARPPHPPPHTARGPTTHPHMCAWRPAPSRSPWRAPRRAAIATTAASATRPAAFADSNVERGGASAHAPRPPRGQLLRRRRRLRNAAAVPGCQNQRRPAWMVRAAWLLGGRDPSPAAKKHERDQPLLGWRPRRRAVASPAGGLNAARCKRFRRLFDGRISGCPCRPALHAPTRCRRGQRGARRARRQVWSSQQPCAASVDPGVAPSCPSAPDP
eukprot:364853-Chlamydomonas_euryale.AAC.3